MGLGRRLGFRGFLLLWLRRGELLALVAVGTGDGSNVAPSPVAAPWFSNLR